MEAGWIIESVSPYVSVLDASDDDDSCWGRGGAEGSALRYCKAVSSGFMGSSGGLNPIFGTEGVSQFGWEKNPVNPLRRAPSRAKNAKACEARSIAKWTVGRGRAAAARREHDDKRRERFQARPQFILRGWCAGFARAQG